jgi:hypothetical protein
MVWPPSDLLVGFSTSTVRPTAAGAPAQTSHDGGVLAPPTVPLAQPLVTHHSRRLAAANLRSGRGPG